MPVEVMPKGGTVDAEEQAANRRLGTIARRSTVLEMVEMQARLKSDVLNPKTEPKDAAACARAYEVLERRKRFNRGLADPANTKTEPKRSKSSQPTAPTFSEPKPK